MMKRILILAVLFAVLLFGCAEAGVLEKQSMTFAGADSLKLATTADTVISGAFNISACDFVGAEVKIDITSGAGTGAAAIYFQGRVGSRAWENIAFCNYSDSLDIVMSLAVTGTTDMQRYVALTIQAAEWNAEGIDVDDTETEIIVGNYLPYDQVRLYVLDTNWVAWARVYGTWLYRRE
jgi:hypothetical protein